MRERAGLDDVRIHDLRHSYASRALALGESLSAIGRLLGHRHVVSTARYAYVDAPLDASRNSATRGMRSGTVVCSASRMRHSYAAGLYGVRGSDPNRTCGVLESPARNTGFSDPVSLTFCPYVVFRPNRTNRGHPRITPSDVSTEPDPFFSRHYGAGRR